VNPRAALNEEAVVSEGSITLGEVAEHTAVLAVACSRCERAGRYNLDTLKTDADRQRRITESLASLLPERVRYAANSHVKIITGSSCERCLYDFDITD
jgi:hypothetical protein